MTNYKVAITLDANGNAVAKFQELNTQLKETKETTGQGGLLGNLGPLGTAVAAVGGAFAAMQIAQKAIEMRNLGQTVQQTANTYIALQGGAQAAEVTMTSLRAATRGLVEDTTLMSGASQMLRTGVATNNAELTQLIEMAVALKKPTDSAAEALDNFTAMMANQSVLRLDSFGISSGRVTARIEELIAAGQAAGREDAFRMAVLEEGATAMDRLGSSIDQNVSQWDRLMVRGQNAIASIGQAAFGIGEAVAGGVNDALDAVVTLISRLEEIETDREIHIRVVEDITGEVTQASVDAVLAGVEAGVRETYAEMTGLTAEQLAPVMESLRAMIQGGAIGADLTPDEQIRQYEYLTGQVIAGPQRQVIVDTLQGYITSIAVQAVQDAYEAGTLEAGTDDALMRGMQAWRSTQTPQVRGVDFSLTRAYQDWQQETGGQSGLRRMGALANPLWSGLESYRAGVGSAGSGQDVLATVRQWQDAQRAQAADRNYSAQMYGALRDQRGQAAAEWGAGRILDIWGGITDRAADVAGFFDNALQAAEGIRNKLGEANDKLASALSGVLGLGVTGGFESDVYSQIAALIGDEEARTAFEMGTGLTTTGQGAFSDVTSFIAEMSGGGQVQAAQALAAFMQSGQFSGNMTQADLMRQIGYYGREGGGEFQVNAGDTYADLEARYGLSSEEVMRAAGITNSRLLLPGTYGAGGDWRQMVDASGTDKRGEREFTEGGLTPLDQMAKQAQSVSDQLEDIKDDIKSLDGVTASIRFVMSADMPPILQEILGYTSVGQMLTTQARNNGGVVPGTNPTSKTAGRQR